MMLGMLGQVTTHHLAMAMVATFHHQTHPMAIHHQARGYGGSYGYGEKGGPPPPPQGGAAGYGGYDMYAGYPPPGYGGSYGSFEGKGEGRHFDRRDERRDGRGRDDRDDDRPRRDYDGGQRGGRREGGKGFEGYGRGVPLPEPVELLFKGLPMDASEPALRSLFAGKGLHFDSVQFSMSAIVKVSGQSLAEQVVNTFHRCPIAGKPIECVRMEDVSRSRPRSRPRVQRSRSVRSPPRRGGSWGSGDRSRRGKSDEWK
eukprot:symbB.v1.2.023648.t1/scaffold2175.1/size86943/3